MPTVKPRFLFFDLDNTLYPADTVYENGMRRAWRVFHKCFKMPYSRFLELYGRARRMTKDLIEGSPSSHNRILYFKNLTELVCGRPVPALAMRLNRAYDGCWAGLRPAKLRPLLAGLSRRYGLGIISNQVCLTQLMKLERLDPKGRWFSVVVTSEEVGVEKPHRAIYREACRRAGCCASEAVMIGDDWEGDVLGALRAGLTPIHYWPSRRPAPRLRPPVRRIRDLRMLEGILP